MTNGEDEDVPDNHHSVETRLAIMEERVSSIQTATRLQATEYERRLQELNHAHAQQAERNALYLPREYFDMHHSQLESEVESTRRAIELRLVELELWRWKSTGIAIGAGGVLGALISFLMKKL